MTRSEIEARFNAFFGRWLGQLDEHLKELLRVSSESTDEAEQKALISKVTTHIKEFYTVKWASAHEDVLVFYCPFWMTTVESAYSWLTGWKPSTIFRLVESMRLGKVQGPGLEDLTEQQMKKIEELRLKIKLEEAKVDRDMERQQVALADRKMLELARLVTRFRTGLPTVSHVDALVEVALKSVQNGLEKVMKAADCVRLKTLKGLLDIMNTNQGVRFLAGNSLLQIQLRKWGKNRDTNREAASA